MLLAAVDTLYPVVLDKFDRSPTIEEAAVAFLSHVVLALLGAAAGCLFTKKLFPRWYAALGGLLAVVIAAIAGLGIAEALPPAVRWLGWLLPPVFRTMDMLNDYERASPAEVVLGVVLPLLYAAALYAAYVALMARRRF